MKQIIQNYKSGEVQLVEVPIPSLRKGCILVQNHSSLVSVGTERYMLDLAKKSLFGKALARPDLVKQVISKARTDGMAETYRQVMGRLDTPIPLGYSSSGRVIAVGEGVEGLSQEDRVACAGSGYAIHAEILGIPRTLAIKIPENVGFEAAAFVALGSIAMHGIRMTGATFGECVVVIGLGLLGQLAVQLLNQAGCRVFGLDINPQKVQAALALGAHAGAVMGQDETLNSIRAFTQGHGADAVIIFAGTKSNEPLELAAEIARERARIVVPGLVGLNIPRKMFYEKELQFLVSRAWGPGIYDPEYESGKDYPFAFVRWTAQRNMAHFLDLVSDGKVMIDPLITHRFPFDRALKAYDLILKGKEPVIGVILDYGRVEPKSSSPTAPLLRQKNVVLQDTKARISSGPATVSVGMIGAGVFARGTLLPAMKEIEGVRLSGVCTSTGMTGEHIGKKNAFRYCTTDPEEIIKDENSTLVMILTRHGSHARWVCEALRAGKPVFVEKPLCTNEAQLAEIIDTYSELRALNSKLPFLMVGFNRRFAPITEEAIQLFSRIPRPLMITVRANVGYIGKESWIHDPEDGGGNIIGEACHFVDLVQAITGSVPVLVYTQPVKTGREDIIAEDNVAMTFTMADGSVCSINYTALGNKASERERVEIFGGGIVCVIENFKRLTLNRGGKRKQKGHWLQSLDKGHRAEMTRLFSALKTGQPSPVPFESYVATTRATFAAVESLRSGKPVDINLSI